MNAGPPGEPPDFVDDNGYPVRDSAPVAPVVVVPVHGCSICGVTASFGYTTRQGPV